MMLANITRFQNLSYYVHTKEKFPYANFTQKSVSDISRCSGTSLTHTDTHSSHDLHIQSSFQPSTNSTPKAKTFLRPESGPPPTLSFSYVPPFSFYPTYYCLHLDPLINSQPDFLLTPFHYTFNNLPVTYSAHYLNRIPNFLWPNSSFPLNLIHRISFSFTTLYQSRPNKLISFFPSLPFHSPLENLLMFHYQHRIMELEN